MKEERVASPRPGRGRFKNWRYVLVATAVTLGAQAGYAQQPNVPTLRPLLPAGKPQTAALPPAGSPAIGLPAIPQPLSLSDAERYRQIFELERAGRFYEAESTIGWLTDHRLLGHVLALRYLSPTYHARYRELTLWLDRYGDHPEAWRLYQLAQKRRPAGAAHPRKPEVDVFQPGVPDEGSVVGAGPDWQKGLALWRRGNLSGAATAFETADQVAARPAAGTSPAPPIGPHALI